MHPPVGPSDRGGQLPDRLALLIATSELSGHDGATAAGHPAVSIESFCHRFPNPPPPLPGDGVVTGCDSYERAACHACLPAREAALACCHFRVASSRGDASICCIHFRPAVRTMLPPSIIPANPSAPPTPMSTADAVSNRLSTWSLAPATSLFVMPSMLPLTRVTADHPGWVT